MIAVSSPPRKHDPNGSNDSATPRKNVLKNVGSQSPNENNHTAFTGGPFDQHDTAAAAAMQPDDTTSLASFDSETNQFKNNTHRDMVIITCQDAEQVERDVTRCTWHLLTGGQRTRRRIMLNKNRKKISRILRRKQRRLGDLINLTLAMSEEQDPEEVLALTLTGDGEDRLCYYQGYHDVASIFLAALGGASIKAMQQQKEQQQLQRHISATTGTGSQQQHHATDESMSTTTAAAQAATMGLELSSKVLYHVSLSHFREPMRSNFLQLQTALRMVLFPLLRIMDPEVHAHLYACGMEPFFALSWMLTWFSHDIRDTALVKRLFDCFLVSHPLMPIYLSVAMLCHPSNRQEILSTPCEFAELHHALSGLPKNSSMVGWKYRVGDGYVSDDEEIGDGETTSISLDSDMASHLSSSDKGSTTRGREVSLLSGNEGMMHREDLILTEGHAQVVSMGIPAHVPFQDLIDTAISFMRRVPPRKLLDLATRYFDPVQAEPILKMYPNISLFHAPPAWALARSAKADWVLKQRTRERQGLSPKTRKDRRALSELRNRSNAAAPKENDDDGTSKSTSCKEAKTIMDNDEADNLEESGQDTPETVQQLAKQLKWPKAYVAMGFGPGVNENVRQKKRRKQLLVLGGAATVAVVAIAIGISMQHRNNLQLQRQEAILDSRASRAAKGGGSSSNSRDQAISYVKSAGKPDKSASMSRATTNAGSNTVPEPTRYTMNVQIPVPAPVPAPAPVPVERKASPSTPKRSQPSPSALESKITNTESPLQAQLKKMGTEQLKLLHAKVQLVRKLIIVLKSKLVDPNLRENILRNMSGLVEKVSQLTKEKVSQLTIPEARDVPAWAKDHVTRFTVNLIKFTAQQAQEHLGGDELDNLPLM